LSSFEDLFENAPCGYILLDAEGVISMPNATLLSWLGYRRDELIGIRMINLLKIAGKVFYETHFAPLLRMQGFCDEIAFDLKCKDGTILSVIASATVDKGDITRIAVFRATQRRKLERHLVETRDAADEAQATLAAQNTVLRSNIKKAVGQKREAVRERLQEQEDGELREQFVAVLGHDLRNPLASITAAARILSREYTSERAANVIELMEGSIKRMSGLIDNVLDFARGRLGGGIGLNRRNGEELEPIIRQVVAEIQTSAPDRKIIAEIDVAAPVSCDSGRLGQLLSNILGNAVSHGSADQPITVRARTSASGELKLSVANKGEVIAPDVLDRLFEPFVRGESRGYQQGLGLGLHIASEIAKAHGGDLSVTSTEAETRFTFTMPAQEVAED
jgi:sigma-B regulation protein RsbU (phosphoserine phosphatase)